MLVGQVCFSCECQGRKMLLDGGGGGLTLYSGPTYMYLLGIGGSVGMLPQDIFLFICSEINSSAF